MHLRNSWPINVSLKEGKKTTSIILTLPLSGQQLSKRARDAYFHSGMSFTRAFDEIVWKTRRTKERSFWAQFAKTAHDAYWEAWTHLLTEVYRKHSEPQIDKKLGEWLSDLVNLRKPGPAGRRVELDAEMRSLFRRLRELEPWCKSIHKLVEKSNGENLPRFEVRLKVFKTIYGRRGDDAILSGRAFEGLPNKSAALHDARTWKPRQLAFALLGSERGGLEYATIARKIGARSHNKKQSR